MPTATAAAPLRKKAKVVAKTDLRDVPEGTAGRVMLVDGISWIRYWVRFDNGVSLGSIPRAKLATQDEWERRHDAPVEVAAASTGGAAAAAEADDAGAGGGKTTPSGTLVPQKLLDRSAAAHARLGR